MIIHDIDIQAGVIRIGITTEGRWKVEKDSGHYGGEAKTLAWCELEDLNYGLKSSWAPDEKIVYHMSLLDPDRELALEKSIKLPAIAWAIFTNGLTQKEAIEKYFGTHI